MGCINNKPVYPYCIPSDLPDLKLGNNTKNDSLIYNGDPSIPYVPVPFQSLNHSKVQIEQLNTQTNTDESQSLNFLRGVSLNSSAISSKIEKILPSLGILNGDENNKNNNNIKNNKNFTSSTSLTNLFSINSSKPSMNNETLFGAARQTSTRNAGIQDEAKVFSCTMKAFKMHLKSPIFCEELLNFLEGENKKEILKCYLDFQKVLLIEDHSQLYSRSIALVSRYQTEFFNIRSIGNFEFSPLYISWNSIRDLRTLPPDIDPLLLRAKIEMCMNNLLQNLMTQFEDFIYSDNFKSYDIKSKSLKNTDDEYSSIYLLNSPSFSEISYNTHINSSFSFSPTHKKDFHFLNSFSSDNNISTTASISYSYSNCSSNKISIVNIDNMKPFLNISPPISPSHAHSNNEIVSSIPFSPNNDISCDTGVINPSSHISISPHSIILEKSQHLKVLIADDSKVSLRLANLNLSRYGYQVDLASNGKEALDLLKKNNYEIAIIDINMPDLDGYEVVTAFRDYEKRKFLEDNTTPTDINELLFYYDQKNKKKNDNEDSEDFESFVSDISDEPEREDNNYNLISLDEDDSFDPQSKSLNFKKKNEILINDEKKLSSLLNTSIYNKRQFIIGISEDNCDIQKAAYSGFDCFINKPFTIDKFYGVISATLRQQNKTQ